MKRLMSMVLALLMLVGMALAETSDDTLLGDWYGLWADTPFHLMLAENDEFQMSAGDFSCAGRWWQTEDGDYYLASPDMIGGMLLRETGSGLAFRFKQMEDMEILLARSMDEWTTPLVVRTDTPLEAFQGTWAVESARKSPCTQIRRTRRTSPLRRHGRTAHSARALCPALASRERKPSSLSSRRRMAACMLRLKSAWRICPVR